ncbi:DNA glycosylase AlkZ-like family protein [Lysobacter korlensis]|uniref:DNA glycosylase AlkZ-like family protein n=1 Tax=Lysobacter korlensis TaxID=553636 RepID=A0ABV6RXG7_9GAMM
MALRLTLPQARQIAVRAQLLDRGRPEHIVDVVRQLTLLQIDPTAAVAPNADLVLWSRIGASYRPEELKRELEEERSLFELDALIRPMEDLPLFLAGMAAFPVRERTREWLHANDRFRVDVLARLRDAGPLRSRNIPDTCVVPWASTGWTNNRNVTQLLEILVLRGEVAIARREGRERFFDLAERVYPAGVAPLPLEEARRIRDERRLRSLGIARTKAPEQPIEPVHVGQAGEDAVVDGVPGSWRVDPEAIGVPFEGGRTALLSPFDRLIYDRVRAQALFGFEYVLEMYKPAAQRRWGYFALPILSGDRLVGKLDALADRKRGVLTVHAVHEDVPFSTAIRDDVERELDDLATWLGLTR